MVEIEEVVEATGYSYGKCVVAKAMTKMLNNNAYGFTNNGTHFSFHNTFTIHIFLFQISLYLIN